MNLIEALNNLSEIYKELDSEVARLETVHSERLKCKSGCNDCCIDDISVFDIEAQNIKSKHPELLSTESPSPLGACAFLDKNGNCRIYDDRPYVCRTQGLPLRWITEQPDGEYVEMRDICPINETDEQIEYLKPSDCWTIGPFEEKLAQLQIQIDGGEFRRTAMRSLFKNE